MRRRNFITLLGGAAATWPLTVRAQQREQMKRIGILLPGTADNPVFQARLAAFYQELALLGWSIDRNVRIDTHWATANAAEIRKHADELAALAPDVILATGDSTVPPLLQATRTVPIVFPLAGDPVGAGFVDSLARPGGNATGFMIYEYGMGGKWLELLKEIAPNVTRVAVLRDPASPSQTAQFGAIRAMASSVSVEVIPVNVRDADEIERAIGACPLLRSLLGVKRTCPFAMRMSAFDPKRTFSLFASVSPKFCPPFVVYEVGTGASVHHA
jgi:putative ABC transport system substrate-binding protein